MEYLIFFSVIAVFFIIYLFTELSAKNKQLFSVQKELKDSEKRYLELCAENEREKQQISEPEKELKTEANNITTQFEITDEFLEVEKLIDNGEKIIFVHGGAGTGKSTLIQYLREKKKLNILLAPTGMAALNINGCTIHKFFGLPSYDIFEKTHKFNILPKESQGVLLKTKIICIDEISMVKADLMDAINKILQNFFNNKEAFGGLQIILFGDAFQLPPVTTKNVLHFFDPTHPQYSAEKGWDNAWFFSSEVLKTNKMKIINLTKTFRQNNESVFCKSLNELRKYQNITQNINYINSNVAIKNENPEESIIITSFNNRAEKYNIKKLNDIPSPQITFTAVYNGIFNSFNEKNYPAQATLNLKVGAFVILLYNDTNNRFVNGSSGIITSIDVENNLIGIKLKNKQLIYIGPYTWKSYIPEYNEITNQFEYVINGTFTQYPLKLAYAITCHKAQGKTLDSVYIDVETFSPGQMYVALSRVRNIESLTLKKHLTLSDFPSDINLVNYF